MKTIILTVLLLNGLSFSTRCAESHFPIPVIAEGIQWPSVSQFKVQQQGERVVITWKAAADDAVIYQVEKSVDARHFSTVAIVMGGFSNGNGFDFEFREKATSEKIIYRIKQIKEDGSFRIAGEQSL